MRVLHRRIPASLVDRFNVPLLQALARERGSAAISRAGIDQLRALDLFREIPGLPETWFAFHPLFREILRGELQRSLDEAAIAALRHGVARWFAAAGLTREAIQHLVALGDIPAAAALIKERAGAAFAREDWPSVAAWLSQDSARSGAAEPGAAAGFGLGGLPERALRPGGRDPAGAAHVPHVGAGNARPAR